MLNLWVYDDDSQNEYSDLSYSELRDKWEPVQNNHIFQEQECQQPVALRSVRSSDAGTDLTDVKITQVPVVSTGGSDHDTKSRASGYSREFYTQAQQLQIFKAQYDLAGSRTAGDEYQSNQPNFGKQNIVDSQRFTDIHTLNYHNDNQNHYDFRSRSHYGYGDGGDYIPDPYPQASNCDLINNHVHQAPSVAPVTTCSQYSYSEYATSHHPSQCNDSAYEYNNYSHPQGQSGSCYVSQRNPVIEPQWQVSAQHLAPFTQETAPAYDLDIEADRDSPVDFLQQGSDLPISDISPIDLDFGEKPPSQSTGTKDAVEDNANHFHEMYHHLCLFYKTYGHTNVPKVSNWVLLGSWVDSLRKRKKFQILAERGINVASHLGPPLTYEEISLLENIGFNWTATRASENAAIVAGMKNVDKLIVGQATMSCNPAPLTGSGVASSSEEDLVNPQVDVDFPVTLGTDSGLESTSDILEALPSVAVESDGIKPYAYPEPQAVVSGNATKIIPKTLKEKSVPKPMKDRVKKKNVTTPTLSLAEKSGGSDFSTISEQLWNAQFKRLVEFHRIHGTTAVPARHPKDPKLGHWVMTQRRQYQLMQSGKPSRMNKERVELLSLLGFMWSIRKDPETMWQTRFQELVKYKEAHGNCLVPQRFIENPQLGTWVNTQRRHYKLLTAGKKSCMTHQRRKLLDEVGFFWSTTSYIATKEDPT